MKLAIILLSVALFVELIDNFRVRFKLRDALAQKVIEALADTVVVDGVQLPKPEDERWMPAEYTARFTDGSSRDVHVVQLGLVVVSNDDVTVNRLPLKRTQRITAYIAQVWRNHRSRVVVKSLREPT